MDTKKFIENWLAKFQSIQTDFAFSITEGKDKSITVYVRGFDDGDIAIDIVFYTPATNNAESIMESVYIFSYQTEESIAAEYERVLSYAKNFVK